VKATHVKRAFKYRFYPTDTQAVELSRTFGCVRKVYNLALAARTEAWTRQERINYNQTSAMLTAWKKTEELAYLNDVSCVPLQQALRHLQVAFTNFFGKRAKYPRFKSRKNAAAVNRYSSCPAMISAPPTTVRRHDSWRMIHNREGVSRSNTSRRRIRTATLSSMIFASSREW
jgi:transposase